MGASPFDSPAELGGGVASLGLAGTVVKDLKEPVVLEMPGGRNGSRSTDLFLPSGELADLFDGRLSAVPSHAASRCLCCPGGFLPVWVEDSEVLGKATVCT
jgi:hypothetical protein